MISRFKISWGFVTLLLTVILLFFSYGDILIHPNSYVLRGEGDGFLNYFTINFHVSNGEKLSHFEGLNYPYGESVFYLGQPLLISFLKFLHYLGWKDIPLYGIINYMQFINIIVSVVILYLVFSKQKVKGWMSSIGAIGIVLASPQMFRINFGHFGLAYSFIPLLFIYFLLCIDSERLKSVLIGLLLFFSTYLHMYYFLFIGGWILCYQAVLYLSDRDYKRGLKSILFQLLIPGGFVFYLLKVVDKVKDRPDSPNGFLWFRSNLEGVFLPSRTLVERWFSENVLSISIPPTDEGDAYIGPFSVVFCVVICYTMIKNKKWSHFFKKTSSHYILVLSAIPILLFSFGWPFIFGEKFEILLDYLVTIKQFRTIGRFSWPFYYAINIAAVIWFSRYIAKRGVLIGLKVLFVSYSLLTMFNFVFHAAETHNDFAPIGEISINTENYQAILPLPMYHSGSEFYLKYDAKETNYHVVNSMKLAVETGLPIFSSYLARTSFSQTNGYLDFLYGEMSEPFKAKLNNESFLVLRTNSNVLNENEEILFKNAKSIYKNGEIEVLSLSSDFVKNFKVKKPKGLNFEIKSSFKSKEFSFRETKEPFVGNVSLTQGEFDRMNIEFSLPIPQGTDEIPSGMVIKCFANDELLSNERFPLYTNYIWKNTEKYFFRVLRDIPKEANRVEVRLTSRSRIRKIILKDISIGFK